MLDQTWDTPDINDTLSDQKSIPIQDDGWWCFKVAHGLWYIWFDYSPEEIDHGMTMNAEDIKAFVRNEGFP
jgi:hypothetical protein